MTSKPKAAKPLKKPAVKAKGKKLAASINKPGPVDRAMAVVEKIEKQLENSQSRAVKAAKRLNETQKVWRIKASAAAQVAAEQAQDVLDAAVDMLEDRRQKMSEAKLDVQLAQLKERFIEAETKLVDKVTEKEHEFKERIEEEFEHAVELAKDQIRKSLESKYGKKLKDYQKTIEKKVREIAKKVEKREKELIKKATKDGKIAAVKKPASKKAAPKKTVAKKTVTKKVAAKKAAPKKGVAKKAAVKPTPKKAVKKATASA